MRPIDQDDINWFRVGMHLAECGLDGIDPQNSKECADEMAISFGYFAWAHLVMRHLNDPGYGEASCVYEKRASQHLSNHTRFWHSTGHVCSSILGVR